MGQSLLSRHVIEENLGKGIIIHPFIPEQLKTTSYDVRLGNHYFARQPPSQTGDYLFNPFNKDAVERHFGEGLVAKAAKDSAGYGTSKAWLEIEQEDQIIVLEPGEMILGHTDEFIGGTRDPQSGRCFVAEMKARSSVGRIGLEVCRCAGWGDVGYVNRWTMEIVNTTDVSIILVVGMRLAQMKFYEVDPIEPEELYGYDPDRDHYQGHTDIEAIQAAWSPKMLLPRITKT